MTEFAILLKTWDTETLREYNEYLTDQRKAYERENLFTVPQYRKISSRIRDVRRELQCRR